VASAPRRFGLCAALLAAMTAYATASAAQDAPADNSALTIISRSPTAEFRVHGVSLKSVRSDDAQNEVAFDFNGPVSDEIFARLKDELPEWIDLAYAGYDNAVIRAKRPATFLARTEADGFSMRIMPRDATAPSNAPGSEGVPSPPVAPVSSAVAGRDWHIAPIARASAERPFDAHLRAGYDTLRTGDAAIVRIASQWRRDKAATLYTTDGHFDVPVDGDIRLIGDVRGVVVNAKAVRQLTGAVAPLNDHDVSGSAGISFTLDGTRIAFEGLYGRLGFGGRVGLRTDIGGWLLGFNAAYHEPYTDTAEAIALKGARDSSALFAAGQIFDGLWATGEAFAARYVIKGDQNVARTAGWHAGLRYEFAGWPFSLTYDGDGEYIVDAHEVVGPAPSPFIPLSIRTRELHRFGVAFSDTWADSLWFDLYGGYAIDRYGKDGPYGGAALRFTPRPGFDIALNGRYSAAAERQGESGNVFSAGFSLTYAWGAADAPIFRGN
jgi:hypothetical protein